MKIFAFDARIGKEITSFGSKKVLFTRIANLSDEAQISAMEIFPQGVIGGHQAATPQLFLVVSGAGWVRGKEQEKVAVKFGEAVFWEAGEWHESGSDEGMKAIVIEVNGEKFNPAEFLLELEQ